MAQGNFFQNLLASLLGSDDINVVQKKMLKKIAKNLSKTKYKFYKYSSHEVDISLAKFFYDIYKAVSAAQLMFANSNANSLKRVVIDLSLSEEQHKALEDLSEESITEASRSMSIQELNQKVKATIQKFNEGFNNEKILSIDGLYTKLILLKNFCQYDFFFLLKKFDSGLRERNFDHVPKFTTINGSYVIEDLKNFTAVAWLLPFDDNWEGLFKLLKSIKGVEPITLGTWKKIISRLKSVRDERIFEMMIQLITENPTYKEVVKPEEHHILEDFISQTRKTAEDTLDNIKKEQTAGKVDNCLTQIFGDSNIEPLKNYNETTSSAYARKDLDGFLYCAPLSYLKQFLLDFVKKDVRELSDILLVRGSWLNPEMGKPMSESFHQLMDLSGAIVSLDAKLAEDGEYGNKLKTILPRVERDKEARNICSMVLNDANYEAANILLSAKTNLVSYDRNLKMLLEDFVKTHSEIVSNWKEIDRFAEGKLKQMCVDVYKMIFNFVSLLQNFEIYVNE